MKLYLYLRGWLILILTTMAKSKSFFGLRRGSTKSHTYSILNGQQITKDRVQTVANPKTQKQQFQRAIMATVMAAYSEMKEIEDHAFQGKKKGSENQREFMSRNLVAMRNAFLSYQDNNTAVANQKYFAVGPKTPTVLPAEWILSHGTMEEQTFLTYEDGNHTLNTPNIRSYNEASGGYESTLGDLADNLGIIPGMQITFVCVNATNGPRIYEVDSADYAGYNDFKFRYCRVAFKNFDRNEVVASATASVLTLYQNFLEKVLDYTRTTPSFASSLVDDGTVPTGSSYVRYDGEDILSGAAFDETLTGGIGIITSMVDGVDRSSSKMQVRNIANLASALGLSWNWVPLAWQNAGANLGESELYLEGGN